jgi:hypothetical protein
MKWLVEASSYRRAAAHKLWRERTGAGLADKQQI